MKGRSGRRGINSIGRTELMEMEIPLEKMRKEVADDYERIEEMQPRSERRSRSFSRLTVLIL